MSALLASFLACLILEMGDGGQKLTLALARRYGSGPSLFAGMAVAAFAGAALSAVGGMIVAPMLGSGARDLFLAVSMLISGGGLFFRQSHPDTLDNWRIGAFATTALGLFILAFGNGAQFLAFGIATRLPDPILIFAGTGLGTLAAWMPAAIGQQAFFDVVPIIWIRRITAIALVVGGCILGLGALALL